VEKNRMRADWMNPSDQQNPENGTHKATLPTPENNQELAQPKTHKKRFKLFRKPINPESYQE
jgi:hypothetical protein